MGHTLVGDKTVDSRQPLPTDVRRERRYLGDVLAANNELCYYIPYQGALLLCDTVYHSAIPEGLSRC